MGTTKSSSTCTVKGQTCSRGRTMEKCRCTWRRGTGTQRQRDSWSNGAHSKSAKYRSVIGGSKRAVPASMLTLLDRHDSDTTSDASDGACSSNLHTAFQSRLAAPNTCICRHMDTYIVLVLHPVALGFRIRNSSSRVACLGTNHIDAISRRANTCDKANDGNAPLHMACWNGHLDIVKILCKAPV